MCVVLIAVLPLGYLLVKRNARQKHALLMVSTDEIARKLVALAGSRAGYRVFAVFRYEDGFEKLKQDFTISMIIVDDSVPQYEAGLLLSRMQGSPVGVRPLILIVDSSELEQTAPSYRAAVVVSRPLTEHALYEAIHQVRLQIEF